jgi:hypothetical protein
MRDTAGEFDDLLAAADLPQASETTLPCSAVMMSAISCLRRLSSSRKPNNTAERLANEVSRHAGNAAAASIMIIARSSSALPNTTASLQSGPAAMSHSRDNSAMETAQPATARASIRSRDVFDNSDSRWHSPCRGSAAAHQ